MTDKRVLSPSGYLLPNNSLINRSDVCPKLVKASRYNKHNISLYFNRFSHRVIVLNRV